jgi:hypothetical protein
MAPDGNRMRLAPLPRAGQRAPDRAADAITRFAGSMLLIYRHLVWFVLWTVANVAAPSRFDSHPLWTAHPRRVAGARLLSAFVISPDREAQLRDPSAAGFRIQRARRGMDRDDRRQAGRQRAPGAREGRRAHGDAKARQRRGRRLQEWPAHDRPQPLPGSRLVAPAGWMGCRFTEVVEGRLLGGLWPLGPLVAWPLRAAGVVPTCVAFTSCWRHQPPADQPTRGQRPRRSMMAAADDPPGDGPPGSGTAPT